MVKINPFCGLRYNQEKVKDFNLVITPPYDVINEQQKKEYYASSPYNAARLILPDSPQKAASDLKDWQEKGILKQDDKESIYIYLQEFSFKGKQYLRKSFISLIELEEFGKGVLPHERTLEKPFKGRLELLDATRANFGCVFMLYDDRKKATDKLMDEQCKREPDMMFSDNSGISHKLWKISDNGFIENLKNELVKYQCVIADGHHRYRSALKFRDEHPEIAGGKYCMCGFVNSFSEGLLILPIDRFVHDVDIGREELIERISEHFEVLEIEDVKKLVEILEHTKVLIDKAKNLKNHVFGMYSCADNKSYFLKLKNRGIMDSFFLDRSDAYRKLAAKIFPNPIF